MTLASTGLGALAGLVYLLGAIALIGLVGLGSLVCSLCMLSGMPVEPKTRGRNIAAALLTSAPFAFWGYSLLAGHKDVGFALLLLGASAAVVVLSLAAASSATIRPDRNPPFRAT